tara:strand:+ start:699 stop:971 length:273 start_codon:yes stop_codon:yes gene_type:complete
MPDSIEQRMGVVERLTGLFKFERMVYLSVTVISLIMLLISGASLIYKGKAGSAELSLLFGSSGLITYTAGRLLFMWNEALKRLIPSAESE